MQCGKYTQKHISGSFISNIYLQHTQYIYMERERELVVSVLPPLYIINFISLSLSCSSCVVCELI